MENRGRTNGALLNSYVRPEAHSEQVPDKRRDHPDCGAKAPSPTWPRSAQGTSPILGTGQVLLSMVQRLKQHRSLPPYSQVAEIRNNS